MQFAVPQFTDIEDKLIGPLTLKQFLFLLATGGVDLFFYSLLKFSVFFFLFALPVTLIGVAVGFAKFNGRPMFAYLGAFVSFFSKPQVRIFKREEVDIVVRTQKAKPAPAKIGRIEEPDQSRLKKLAYLLDQKTEEEKELIRQKTDIR